MTTEPSSPKHSPIPRRAFLRWSGAVLAASAFSAPRWTPPSAQAADTAGKTRIPVGSNIYGWGQYYQRMNKNVNEHLDEVMSALRDAGYDYLEGNVDVNRPENNLRFAERLKSHGLKPVCLYTGARLHEADKANEVVQKLLTAAQACQEAGFKIIDCNPDPIGREKTDAELKTQAAALTDLGRGLKKLGLQLGIHNHTPEMLQRAREFHFNLDQTEPKLVGLCYDVHWIFRGGIHPAEVLKKYGDRLVSFHLRQSRNGAWWEDLDRGDIDYEGVAQFVRERGVTAPLTVELAIENGTAVTRTGVENHRRSREFVRTVFGS